ncbi:hypothetical protein HMPREF1486_03155 [Streptomyces sp. HPH0547]|uniref:hypothetical protein n=1 Tax=Streptomyces sp. HPH0547 TaxID=1203592 RepID=UPI00034E3A20|nr:hypothetical protein [Streptomyces sp. HPH0547]EPD94602.1 hypothetical protein HMPREF1486_03155 [Streptomyces sp. HPH0547]
MPETEETPVQDGVVEESTELQETTVEEPQEGKTEWDPEAASKEIAKLRKEAARYRTRTKELEPLAKRAQELEDAQKSETQRLGEQLTAAQQRLEAVQQRAVRAEVRALAASDFADPEDAAAFLDLGAYVGEDGDVDADAIGKDLKDLLKRKPHLAKDTGPRSPRPDRTQGSSGNGHRTPNSPEAIFGEFLDGVLGR